MKKVIIVSVILMMLAGIWQNQRQGTVKINSAENIILQKTSTVVAVESDSKPVKSPDDVSAVENEVVTLQEIEHEYKNYKTSEMESELAQSKRRLDKLGLLTKSNSETLNLEETKILVLELRKQGVLGHLLAKQKIEQLKRKFL